MYFILTPWKCKQLSRYLYYYVQTFWETFGRPASSSSSSFIIINIFVFFSSARDAMLLCQFTRISPTHWTELLTFRCLFLVRTPTAARNESSSETASAAIATQTIFIRKRVQGKIYVLRDKKVESNIAVQTKLIRAFLVISVRFWSKENCFSSNKQ